MRENKSPDKSAEESSSGAIDGFMEYSVSFQNKIVGIDVWVNKPKIKRKKVRQPIRIFCLGVDMMNVDHFMG